MAGTTIFNLLGKLAIDGVDETTKALEDVAKEGQDTEKKLSVSFQDIGEKAGQLGKNMAVGLVGVATAAIAGVEATREFRTDIGRLESGYKGVGLSGETANKVFKDFYGILGETDTAVEASNLLKELARDEKGLSEWTTIATGVYARFPDSIPIEALIESANETAKVGQITGNLADALNWAGVSEEDFNKKLEKCNTEAKREALIRETLNGLYGASASEYEKNNASVIANNKAQADLNMKMAETMEKLEPLITQGKILLAEILIKAQPLITWIIDNINILAPIILGFMTALFALNIASKVTKFIPIVKALFTLLKANPIGIVITVIGLLVTAFITLWNKCEGFRNFWINLGNTIKNTWNSAINGVKSGIDKAKGFFNDFKNKFEETKNKISRIVDVIKGLFNFTFKTPKIKVPRFTISPSGWKVGDLLKGSIPKLGIDWYAKAMNNPMLLKDPTAFGFSPSGNIRIGGESGDEIVGGANTIMGMISNAVNNNNGGIETKIDKLISLLSMYLPTMSNQQVVLSTGELVGALTSPLDKSLGELANDRRRGR